MDPHRLSPLERRVLELLDPASIEADLSELVAIPSVGGTAAEVEAQDWCADRLAGLGAQVDVWDIDVAAESAARGFPGMEVDRTVARGCVGVLGGSAEPGATRPALVLNGHTDVVPPGDLARWSADPYALRVVDGVATGRGACDMKAGVVAAVAALGAVAGSGVTLARPLAMHPVAGEEDGGIGTFATLRRGHRADACLIAEPTEGAVIPANAGSLTFRIVLEGRAAHGSMRTTGVSAVDLLHPVLGALRRLEAERNTAVPQEFSHLDLAWPLSVGVVRAGDWASTVPDRLVAEGRYGVRTDEGVAEARAAFESAVAEVRDDHGWLASHPPEVTWPGGVFAPGSLPTGNPLLAGTLAAAGAVGFDHLPVRGGPYGSDLRHYAAAGIPTLQLGPGELGQAHAAEESVELSEVLRCAQAYVVLALRRCGTV